MNIFNLGVYSGSDIKYNYLSASYICKIVEIYMKSPVFKELLSRALMLCIPVENMICRINFSPELVKKTRIYNIEFRLLELSDNVECSLGGKNYLLNINVMSSFFKKGLYLGASTPSGVAPYFVTIRKNKCVKYLYFDELFDGNENYYILVDDGIVFENVYISMSKWFRICRNNNILNKYIDLKEYGEFSHLYTDNCLYRKSFVDGMHLDFSLFKNCIFEIDDINDFLDYCNNKVDMIPFVDNKNILKFNHLHLHIDNMGGQNDRDLVALPLLNELRYNIDTKNLEYIELSFYVRYIEDISIYSEIIDTYYGTFFNLIKNIDIKFYTKHILEDIVKEAYVDKLKVYKNLRYRIISNL